MQLQTTQDCIDYCIKYLDENVNEQFCLVEGTNIGEEMVLVYRGQSCDCDADKQPFYEVRVSSKTKSGFHNKKRGFVEDTVVRINEGKA